EDAIGPLIGQVEAGYGAALVGGGDGHSQPHAAIGGQDAVPGAVQAGDGWGGWKAAAAKGERDVEVELAPVADPLGVGGVPPGCVGSADVGIEDGQGVAIDGDLAQRQV